MANYDFDSDCPPLFKSTNYFLWQETMERYIKHKGLDLWEIMVKGPIVIEKSEDEYAEDDYKQISKNFKAINILYCALTVDIYEFISHCDSAREIWETLYNLYGTNQNVVLSEFVAQDEIIMDGNVKQVEDHQPHEEQEHENDDPIQRFIHNDVKHAQIEEFLENDEKNNDSFILQSGKDEVPSKIQFSNNSIFPSCHIFYDLNTTPNFQLSKILDCGIKSRKCVKIEGKKNFTSLIFLTSNNFESKKKRVSRFGRATSFLKKSKKNAHVRGILLIPHLCTNNEFSIVFDPLENLSGQGNIGASQTHMVSYGSPKVKIR